VADCTEDWNQIARATEPSGTVHPLAVSQNKYKINFLLQNSKVNTNKNYTS
jgi:hypothetical protein